MESTYYLIIMRTIKQPFGGIMLIINTDRLLILM